jgi:hypothetical protein
VYSDEVRRARGGVCVPRKALLFRGRSKVRIHVKSLNFPHSAEKIAEWTVEMCLSVSLTWAAAVNSYNGIELHGQ